LITQKFCIICRNKKFDLISSHIRDSNKHKVIRCVKCGHVQLCPVPTPEEDKKFYDKQLQDAGIKYFFKLSELGRLSAPDVDRRAALIRKLIRKNKKILEIGSGDGFFLERMTQYGYDIVGIEVSEQRRKNSKKITKAKVLDIDLIEHVPNIGKYDSILLFQVLEHIRDPVIFLKNISKLLYPHGNVIVEVPNFNDFQIKLNQSYKIWQLQRAHIHYFTPVTLKRVFAEAGLRHKIVGVQRYSIENMFSWKMTNKPQIDNPTFNCGKEYEWIEKYYKTYLEKKLISDTIIAIGGFI